MGFYSKTIAALLLTPLAAFAAGVDSDSLRSAWEDTGRSFFREAHAHFETAEGREARLGEAATLLQLQPKTERNVRDASALLSAIVEASTEDEPGIAALYLLGRIEHIHRATPDLAAAARHYRRLLDLRFDHPLSGQAAAKLAIVELYQPFPDDERLRLFTSFADLAQRLTDAPARRDLHIILGEVALRFQLDPTLALEQFVAAKDAGIVGALLQADTLVRIGGLARELGRTELARESYQAFLAAFPRDNRRLLITEALASLPDDSS